MPAPLLPILALLSGGLFLASKRKSNTLPAECEALTASGGRLAGVDYVEIVTGGADVNDQLPLVVSLHGLGYNSTSHIKWLESLQVQARIVLPNGFYEKGSDQKRAWWSSYSNKALQDASKRLASFVELIAQCRPTSGKPVMTGHSMGGFVALDFATQFPELISASVPVATTRSSALWDILPGVPVHGIHGKMDNSYNAGAAYYDHLAQLGLPVDMTTVSAGAHRLASANAAAWREVLALVLEA
jgi:predicted esterase